MTEILIGVFCTLSGLATLSLLFNKPLVRRRICARLAYRSPASDASFGQVYYPDSEWQSHMADRVQFHLETQYGLDLANLRPEDDLNEDLLLADLDANAILLFMQQLEDELGIETWQASPHLHTVGDWIDFLGTGSVPDKPPVCDSRTIKFSTTAQSISVVILASAVICAMGTEYNPQHKDPVNRLCTTLFLGAFLPMWIDRWGSRRRRWGTIDYLVLTAGLGCISWLASLPRLIPRWSCVSFGT